MPITVLAIAVTADGRYVSRDHEDAVSVPYQAGDEVPDEVLAAFEEGAAKPKPKPSPKPSEKDK